MENNQLLVTLDGPGLDESGLAVEEFTFVLTGIQQAMQIMVGHLAHSHPGPWRLTRWAPAEVKLLLATMRPDSFVAELSVFPTADAEFDFPNFVPTALDALLKWDGGEDSTLPWPVADRLYRVASGLPDGWRLWLGNPDGSSKIEVRRSEDVSNSAYIIDVPHLRGWLKAVNWDTGTAELHEYPDGHIPLQFESGLGEDMCRLATRYVNVKGKGLVSKHDEFIYVRVEKIRGNRPRITVV